MNLNDGNADGTTSRYTRDERLKAALKILRDGRISVLDFILDVLRSNDPEFKTYQARFFENQSGKLAELLDCIFEDKRGQPIFLSWMEPRLIELVSDKVSMEMDDIKVALAWTIKNTTPESLLAWDVDAVISPLVDSTAPIPGRLLRAAAETKRARENNRIKSCTTVRVEHCFRVETE